MISDKINSYIEKIGDCAAKALLYEVSATPKPGLVDRNNTGAHKDMDFMTFMASSAAISKYFYRFAHYGATWEGSDLPYLFEQIRPIGKLCEKNMYSATSGINTHKGLIFSLGILSTAAGYLVKKLNSSYINVEEICCISKEMTNGLSDNDFSKIASNSLCSNGERLFKKFGVKGIRGEAESGFYTVRSVAIPVMDKLMKNAEYNFNDNLIQVLLHLIANTEDTNILSRHNYEILEYAKDYSKRVLNIGGVFTTKGKEILYQMDRDFKEKNISPGGSADLLAVTIMLYLLCN